VCVRVYTYPNTQNVLFLKQPAQELVLPCGAAVAICSMYVIQIFGLCLGCREVWGFS